MPLGKQPVVEVPELDQPSDGGVDFRLVIPAPSKLAAQLEPGVASLSDEPEPCIEGPGRRFLRTPQMHLPAI